MNPATNSGTVTIEALKTDFEMLDLVCFAHERWDFVFQRPQHLMSRFARARRVFYVEEPLLDSQGPAYLEISKRENVTLVTPRLRKEDPSPVATMLSLIQEFFFQFDIKEYVLWYMTPLALRYTFYLRPSLVVYDCIDELSAFHGVPPELRKFEAELLIWSDVVFTGGYSLYSLKKHLHHNVHAFPSSIDVEHFSQAKFVTQEPADQAGIPHPRLGFYGVIDERMDLNLIRKIAEAGSWQIILLGPVCKIDPSQLPQHENIHYLGAKSYKDLPSYLAGWDVALLPFALNEATRYISPTKTPEYLAAGKPVVSTPIRDVVRPYGEEGMVFIAKTPSDFVEKIELALWMSDDSFWWSRRVDRFLKSNSWDATWSSMSRLMAAAFNKRNGPIASHETQSTTRERQKPLKRVASQPPTQVPYSVDQENGELKSAS